MITYCLFINLLSSNVKICCYYFLCLAQWYRKGLQFVRGVKIYDVFIASG